MGRLIIMITLTLLTMGWQGLTWADDDHEKALQLRELGEIMALEEILKHAKKEINGRILELELEREDGIYLYEILILDSEGQLWEIEIDASSGKILKRELED
ncbi:MAG: PepSY domain-containing protein [Gammaproteobacteria bacterium]|nr:PepSY domain-containing protein [Gammaproteobacteria bacterium]